MATSCRARGRSARAEEMHTQRLKASLIRYSIGLWFRVGYMYFGSQPQPWPQLGRSLSFNGRTYLYILCLGIRPAPTCVHAVVDGSMLSCPL